MERLRSLTRLIAIGAFSILSVACGGGADQSVDDTAMADVDADVLADEPATPAPEPDGIPVDITVTLTDTPAPDGSGTFTSSGTAASCQHNPNAKAGQTDAEWHVSYGNDSSPNVQMIQMQIGKAGADGASREMFLMISAGLTTGLGITVPQMFVIGTFPGGSIQGRGVARATRQGDGVKIEVDGEPSMGKTKIKLTVVCRRFDTWGKDSETLT